MKLNLGCGINKINGFVNIDKFEFAKPDLQHDLECFPWPFDDNCADEIVMNHVLEHLGKDSDIFLKIIQELYRISKHGTIIRISVPHPRHDNFINDPTHVRAVTPEMLSLFSKDNCRHWQSTGAANSPLALYIDVDFQIEQVNIALEDEYQALLASKEESEESILMKMKTLNNIAKEYTIILSAIKPSSNKTVNEVTKSGSATGKSKS